MRLMRLDQAIAARHPELSRRKARELIARRRVLVNDRTIAVASREVSERDRIAIVADLPEITVLRETEDWIAVDKPPGIATQPARNRNKVAGRVPPRPPPHPLSRPSHRHPNERRRSLRQNRATPPPNSATFTPARFARPTSPSSKGASPPTSPSNPPSAAKTPTPSSAPWSTSVTARSSKPRSSPAEPTRSAST